MKASTGQHYRKRIGQVIDYIYQHLDRDLDVNTLADVALMSPYHFHRIYREIAQETVNTTVRRLRLQYAAAELIRSETSLADIAKKVAYSSSEAFVRAFDKQFGETPQAYRQRRRDLSLPVEPFIAMLPEVKKEHTAMYDIEMIDVKPLQLLGYEHQGDYMNIGQAFEKVFVGASIQGLIDGNTRSFGIYYDDPQSVPLEQLRSVACISAPAHTAAADNGMKTLSLPGGRCATVLHKGSYAELEKPYSWLFGSWLPASGEEAGNFPPFEEYLNDPKTTPPSQLLTRIYCLLAN
ncbi:MAG: AraC family transcriptional regulator [Pseudomonadales bacterium]|nr:AraC family transcriptional regulator [Pseudomonadales bacterium]